MCSFKISTLEDTQFAGRANGLVVEEILFIFHYADKKVPNSQKG